MKQPRDYVLRIISGRIVIIPVAEVPAFLIPLTPYSDISDVKLKKIKQLRK